MGRGDGKSIDRTDRGWRLSDRQGRETGTYDRWRDAEEERIWGEEGDDDEPR